MQDVLSFIVNHEAHFIEERVQKKFNFATKILAFKDSYMIRAKRK